MVTFGVTAIDLNAWPFGIQLECGFSIPLAFVLKKKKKQNKNCSVVLLRFSELVKFNLLFFPRDLHLHYVLRTGGSPRWHPIQEAFWKEENKEEGLEKQKWPHFREKKVFRMRVKRWL